MVGSSMSSTRTPHTVPVMSVRDGFGWGASEKKVCLKVRLSLELRVEFVLAVAGQPAEDLVDL